MMQITHNDNIKEIYVAKLSKVETKDYQALDYEYFIKLMKGRRKKCSKIYDSDNDLQLVGKMNVSTILTQCHHDNYTMMETQFVLFGNTSTHKNLKKGLFQKLAKIFRTCWRPEPDSNDESEINFLEKNVAPNFELAAIVVRENVPFDCVDKVGGWGLKFLNTLRCECYGRENDEDYESGNSINVIIPAGIHGGPISRKDGPSSLIDRWKSGGACECGGWDEGCPLTVFQTKYSNSENCKSLDIVTQDSSNSSIIWSMRNMKDGLYYGYFEPRLSALQSFAIVLAISHWWNHSLGPITAKKM